MTTTAIVGGSVLVDDEHETRRADVIVCDGRILAIDDPGSGRPVDEVVDAYGKCVMPGFVDGHCHLELAVQAEEFHLPLHGTRVASITEMLMVLSAARRERPHGWIIGRGSFGMQRDLAEGRLPQRLDLDSISAKQPMAVLAGLHVACLNTAAITALGLNDAQNLPDTIHVHTDSDGPTGVFTEVWDRLPTHTVEETIAALRAHTVPIFSRQGTTSVSTISTSAADVRALHRLAQTGGLPLRVRYFVHVPRTATIADVLSWGPESGFGDDMLRFGGVKIFIDGEGGDGLGNLKDDLKWSGPELKAFVDTADEGGIQLLMHAVTPKAVRLAAEAVAAARDRRPARRIHRIEHGADSLDLADLPLLRRAGVGLVATPHFVSSLGADGPDFQPLNTLIAAGHHIIGGTDTTGTAPAMTGALANIGMAASRRDACGKPSRERIAVRDAVRMFTSWSAEGVHEGHEKGRISAGALADFAILSADPLGADVDEIADIRIEQTIVNGKRVS